MSKTGLETGTPSEGTIKRLLGIPALSLLVVLFMKAHLAANASTATTSDESLQVDQPDETEQLQNTLDWFLSLTPAEIGQQLLDVTPWAVALSIAVYVGASWNDRGRPMPATISDLVDRFSEWPHWWTVVLLSAIPETVLIALVWGGVGVRHLVLGEPWEVASERTATFVAELVMSVVRPFVEATGWLGVFAVLAFILFFIGFGFVATPILAYFDLRYIEKNSYYHIPRKYALRFAMFRVFSMISYLRMRRRALDGWVATEYRPDTSRQRHAEGYSRI